MTTIQTLLPILKLEELIRIRKRLSMKMGRQIADEEIKTFLCEILSREIKRRETEHEWF